ncbi:MAG: glycosyltransferase [Chloroflexota bacterium]
MPSPDCATGRCIALPSPDDDPSCANRRCLTHSSGARRGPDRVALLSLHSSPLARAGSAGAGGMNIYVRRLASQLSDRGIQVDVFTRRSDSRSPEIDCRGSVRFIHLSAGPARAVPKSSLSLYTSELVDAFVNHVDRYRRSYDLLHSHYWLSGVVGLRLKQRYDLPLAHMFHTLSKVKEMYAGRPDPSDTLLRVEGERAVLAGADIVVGATEAEQELIRRCYGSPSGLFRAIPPGVDLHRFRRYDQLASRRQLGIEGDPVILFVGRMDGIKGLDLLVEAMPRLRAMYPLLRLVVVGGENRLPVNEYRQRIDELGLTNAVELRGAVPQSKLPLYYSSATVFGAPSAYESFGMAAVESMACQTPVVAFGVAGLAVTIRDNQTGFLVEPGDTDGYIQRLVEALGSPNLVEMGRRARLSVQRYAWETVGRRTVDLYEELLAASAVRERISG